MKKFKFAAMALLMATALTSATSCGGSEQSDNAGDKSKNDSGTVQADTARRNPEGFTPGTNIRYIDLNKVLENYTYATQESKKIQQKAVELQQYQNTLSATLQKKANEVQQKLNSNGYLTEESYKADMTELDKLDKSSSQQYAKRAQAFEAEAAKVQEAIMNAVTNYVIEYNKTHQYDAILYKDAGIYFNPHLDITDEIIEGLNNASTTQSAAKK